MSDRTNEITKEQFDVWHARYKQILAAMKFRSVLDMERDILYLCESMLLKVRLSVGLGDPGSNEKPQTPEEENPDADGVRESD